MMSATPVLPVVAVLDTNVVIAALLWNGPPRLLLARATECDDFILATSPVLIEELVGTLSLTSFQKRIAEAGKSTEAFVSAYRDATTLVSPVAVPRVVGDDIDDDHVIAAAVAARARYIVTGDRRHLLPIGMHGNIAIISPRQCLDLVGG
ncbi:MAG: putative toxin-antitoxin system toxin component, PIN family [Planctomycetota bacterium]